MTLVRSSAIAGKPVLRSIGIDAGLDHFDLDRALRLVVHLDACDGTCRRRSGRRQRKLRKFAVVSGALTGSTSMTMSPSSV